MRNLTTGDCAKFCQVASRTVHKWIDSGLLKGFLIPGLTLTASGPDDMEFLTALAAALIHKRLVVVCKTDNPEGSCFEFTPGHVVDDGH